MNRNEFLKRAVILSIGITAIPSVRGSSANINNEYMSLYPRYNVYEKMENFSKISSALNSLACEISEGFSYHSSDPQIETYLCDLFEGKLDIKNNLPRWVRNTAKYGNTYIHVPTEKEQGILYGEQFESYDCEMYGNSIKVHKIGNPDRVIISGNEHVNFKGLFDATILPYNCSLIDGYRNQFKTNPESVEPYFNDRTKQRLKQSMVAGLNKLVIIHLFSLECREGDLLNFEITL